MELLAGPNLYAPAPEVKESHAVPAEEGIGLDLHQGAAPPEPACENSHDQPSGILGPVWFHLVLLKQRERLGQEEVLGCQCAARPGSEHEKTDEITRDEGQSVEAVCQQLEDGAGHERSALRDVTRLPTGGRAKFLRTTPEEEAPLARTGSHCSTSPQPLLNHVTSQFIEGTIRQQRRESAKCCDIRWVCFPLLTDRRQHPQSYLQSFRRNLHRGGEYSPGMDATTIRQLTERRGNLA